MSRVKLSKQQEEEIKGKISFHTNRIDRLQTLASNLKNPAIALLAEGCQKGVEQQSEMILDIAMNPSTDVVKDRNETLMLGGQLRAYKGIYQDLTMTEKRIDSHKSSIAVLKNQLAEAVK